MTNIIAIELDDTKETKNLIEKLQINLEKSKSNLFLTSSQYTILRPVANKLILVSKMQIFKLFSFWLIGLPLAFIMLFFWGGLTLWLLIPFFMILLDYFHTNEFLYDMLRLFLWKNKYAGKVRRIKISELCEVLLNGTR